MIRKKKTQTEQQIDDVFVHHDKLLSEIQFPQASSADARIAESEELLRSLNMMPVTREKKQVVQTQQRPVLVVPSWESVYKKAIDHVGTGHDLDELFTAEELEANTQAIRELNAEYNALHKLDQFDIGIAAAAGLLGALADILLVGIPTKTKDGLKAGPLSDYVRDYFDKKFPEVEMQKLANSKESKVPFDAQDNRHTTIRVEGLSASYHRMLQLGHDPILGFIFGAADIMNGTMTTVDKQGKIVCQIMENYAERTESDIFAALCKQIAHFKSDITTSMGLPAPLMSLFNLLQFGKIGEEELTIAEIVQGMYYEGYDFIHFCSMSVPSMVTEAAVRMGYAIKRIKEGHSVKESIPFSLNREKHPKLGTMLFIGHSAAVAVNAGKVAFIGNPMAINYPQWLAFAKYSYSQLKCGLLEKPEFRDRYVMGELNEEMDEVFAEIDKNFDELASDRYVIVMD